MDNTTEQNLAIAYELIENDRLHDAVALLEPMLQKEPNNADVWWLYTHAVSEPDKARHALSNVLHLDPNYPGAAELSSSLDAKYPAARTAPAAIKPLSQPSPPPSAPETLPDIDMEEDDVSDLFEDDEVISSSVPTGRRRRFLLPLAAALVIVVLVIAIVVINPFKGTIPTATATSAAQSAVATPTAEEIIPTVETSTEVPTEEPTATQELVSSPSEPEPTATETEESVSATEATTVEAVSPVAPDFSSLTSALSSFDVPEGGIEIMETTLGDTLVATVCGDRSVLAEVMDIVASESITLAADVAGVGVSIGDCASPSTMRVVGVALSNVVAYTNGTLSKQDFQKLWKPIA